MLLFALSGPMVSDGSLTPQQIAERIAPSVVLIKAVVPAGTLTGSGFVVDPSGTIVTNLHVIRGATAVAVKFPGGDVYDVARVRAYDERKDLAVLQIPGFGLPGAELGDSDSVRQGDPVVLYGNPLGLEGSLTSGVVSGLRSVDSGMKVIQTDASANPGNSGGPLLDAKGRVVGVLSFKLSGTEGLNFAIPINYVRGLLQMDHALDLAVLAQRLASSVDALAPTPVFPKRWKSLTSGTSRTLRVEGDRIYVEALVSPETKAGGGFGVGDLAKRSDGSFAGEWRYGGSCSYLDYSLANLRTEEITKTCTFSNPIEISSLGPTRIEGRVRAPSQNAKLDCKKCKFKGNPEWEPFVWIPEAQ